MRLREREREGERERESEGASPMVATCGVPHVVMSTLNLRGCSRVLSGAAVFSSNVPGFPESFSSG